VPIEVRQLEHGRIYAVKSDHFRFGVWDSERGGYVGIKYSERAFRLHLDYDVRFGGGAVAISATDEHLGIMDSLKEYVEVRCQEHDLAIDDTKSDTGRLIWQHLGDGTVCHTTRFYAVRNEALIDALRKAEADEQ